MKENETDGSEFYLNMNSRDLILVGIYYVQKNGEICTFERLVAECFKRFPKVFSFKRYPNWPDAMKFDRALRTLRSEGLAVGSSKDHLQLTPKGEKRAFRVLQKLEGKYFTLNRNKKVLSSRSADERLIAYLEDSPYFKKFLERSNEFALTELEFRNLLRCTMDTPPRVLHQNLKYFEHIAEEFGNQELLVFLRTCEKNFDYLFRKKEDT